MKKPRAKSMFSCLLAVFTLSGVVLGQERAQDRRAWIDENATTTDDPRRVPMPPGQGGPEGTLVLTGGRIFDGTGAAVRDGTIVIERNRITAILPPGSSDWSGDAQVIDVAGKTIMPGLIALHEHMTEAGPLSGPTVLSNEAINTLKSVERLRFYIESGVTSIRDLASHGDIPFRMKEFISENRIPGPRVFPAGQIITSTGGHGTNGMHMNDPLVNAERAVDGVVAWRKAVREQFNKGADVIKLASHYSREEIEAAVDEAHALGLKVTVDAEAFYVQWAVEAGVDCIEHLQPRSDEAIRLMAEKGTESVPTILPFMRAQDREGGEFGSPTNRYTVTRESIMELFRAQKSAGIRMGIGLDMGSNVIALPNTYIEELKYFVQGGYSLSEALVAATKAGAEILDMDDKLGTIAEGKLADVIVIDGRPDNDLEDLAHVDMVVRDGYIVVKDGRVFIPRHVPPGEEE
jgi:imidazolonepropionase-like amidohydrolase